MFASEILQHRKQPVVTIEESRTVHDAIQLLCEKKIGSLLVENAAKQIVGIITERDILHVSCHRSKSLDSILVGEVMTRKMITGAPDETISELLGKMTKHRVRHLPIMRGGKLEGLLSIGDLVKAQLDETKDENRHLRDYIQGHI